MQCLSAECAPINPSDINNVRAWMKVGIFGPYRKRKQVLISGRNHLRQNGFIFSFLVENFPGIGFLDPRTKSDYYLKLMDLVFFVFLFRCDLSGVSLELDDFVREERYLSQYAVAMVEIDERGNTPVTSLLSEKVAKGRINRIWFRTPEEFLDGLRNAAHRHAFKLSARINSSSTEKISFLESIKGNPIYYDRLCDNHSNRASYICIQRCRPTCRTFHLCYACVLSSPKGTSCSQRDRPVFKICPPNLSAFI
jgi:hypothetical protein